MFAKWRLFCLGLNVLYHRLDHKLSSPKGHNSLCYGGLRVDLWWCMMMITIALFRDYFIFRAYPKIRIWITILILQFNHSPLLPPLHYHSPWPSDVNFVNTGRDKCLRLLSAPSHYLNKIKTIVNWALKNKDFDQNKTIFINENSFEKSKYNNFHSIKCLRKCRLQNGGRFVQASPLWIYKVPVMVYKETYQQNSYVYPEAGLVDDDVEAVSTAIFAEGFRSGIIHSE